MVMKNTKIIWINSYENLNNQFALMKFETQKNAIIWNFLRFHILVQDANDLSNNFKDIENIFIYFVCVIKYINI